MKNTWMRYLAAPMVASLLALAGCGGGDDNKAEDKPAEAAMEEAKPEATPEPTPEAKPEAVADAGAGANEEGKKLFSTYCVSCHGEKGMGDGVAGAALNPKPASFAKAEFWSEANRNGDKRTDEHLKKVIKEGGAAVGLSPLMAPWGAVINTDEKLDAIVAYVKSFKPE